MSTPQGGDPFRRPLDADPLGATNETPADLAAVQADDALLNTLGVVDDFDEWLAGANAALIARQARHFDVEVELERVKRAAVCGGPLVAWRRDVETEPIGELVDTDTALAAINSGRPPAGYEPPRPVSPFFAGLVTALTLLLTASVLVFLVLVTR